MPIQDTIGAVCFLGTGWSDVEKKYTDLTTEYQVKGEFADYGVRLDRELIAFIEVKRVATKLAPKHLRQVEMYAVNEGVEWVILTNGATWQVYHLTGGLPVLIDLALDVDLLSDQSPSRKVSQLFYLTRESLKRRQIDEVWKVKRATDDGRADGLRTDHDRTDHLDLVNSRAHDDPSDDNPTARQAGRSRDRGTAVLRRHQRPGLSDRVGARWQELRPLLPGIRRWIRRHRPRRPAHHPPYVASSSTFGWSPAKTVAPVRPSTPAPTGSLVA